MRSEYYSVWLFGLSLFFAGCNKSETTLDYLEQGQLDIERKNWAKAIEDYSRVIESDPKNSDAYGLRAFAEQRLGKTDDALAGFNKDLKLDAGNDWASCEQI